jgi:hypothetical protein
MAESPSHVMPFSPNQSTVDVKSHKNRKERERVQIKNQSLKMLKSFVRESDLIGEVEKKKRFTEGYTVSMATTLIKALEERCAQGGRKRLQAAQGPRGCRKKKKPSNAFINFSAHFRPSFVHALQEVGPGHSKNPSQTIVQKLAGSVWHSMPHSSKEEWELHSADEVLEWARRIISSSPPS